MAKPLIMLKDDVITNIEDDSDFYSGCETCDYGSSYTSEMVFTYADGSTTSFRQEQMYEYGLKMEDVMRAVLTHAQEFSFLTREQFIEKMQEWLKEETGLEIEVA